MITYYFTAFFIIGLDYLTLLFNHALVLYTKS